MPDLLHSRDMRLVVVHTGSLTNVRIFNTRLHGWYFLVVGH